MIASTQKRQARRRRKNCERKSERARVKERKWKKKSSWPRVRILSRHDTFSNEWVKVTNFYLRLGKYFLLSHFTFDYSFCNWDWPSRTDAASRVISTLSFPHFSSFDFQKPSLKNKDFDPRETEFRRLTLACISKGASLFIFEELVRQILSIDNKLFR